MGNLWLPDMDDWLRDIGGLPVETWPNWLTASRGSGGYDDIFGIQVHHDASPTSWTLERSSQYGFDQAQYHPVGALRLDRGDSQRWMVGAAGATNTSGKGGPMACSRGTIPLDSANRYLISIEALNNGVGETWTPANRDAYVRGVAALIIGLREQGAYDAVHGVYRKIILNPLVGGDVGAHFEWAPTRKIDPAGPPDPFADLTDRYQRWKMDQFRVAVADMVGRLSGETPSPPPNPDPGVPMTVEFNRWVASVNGDRVYDSRPNTPVWHNPDVEKVQLAAGEYRKIAVAFAHVAEVRVTAVNADAPGYIVASGVPGVGALPIVNFEPGRVGYDTRMIAVPDGHLYLWLPTSKFGPVDVIVDVFGTGHMD